MREETSDSEGWYRLGQLLIQMGQFDKAEELYGILFQQATDCPGQTIRHLYGRKR